VEKTLKEAFAVSERKVANSIQESVQERMYICFLFTILHVLC